MFTSPRTEGIKRMAPIHELKPRKDYYTANCLVLMGAVFADVPEYSAKAANFCFGNMRAARVLDSVE
jgi:hypothetical protein